MSSNAALVMCARGARNQVSSVHEKQLEEIYTCFERLRVRPLAERKAPRRGPEPAALKAPKALTLPEGLRDWFVNRGVQGLPQWCAATQADEQQLCRHVVALHRLGVPPFFREQLQPLIMKLFVSLEARVPSARIPADDARRAEFWPELKDSLVRLAVPAMAEVVFELFGRSSSLVVVLDASGWSPAAGHWKVSQRICFVDVAVSLDTARRARGMLVRRLERACRAGGFAEGGLAAGLIEDASGRRTTG
ncbi:unnamed protein product [Prorocentrum cordatum]|uniref:Uncharacterized protein n=1 Tax=Prorocentrum cordatum TaxID=2364126 RepID=A0ABN9X095_9DINO|nr:unnamed protein product [Polarella glacialis]